MKLRILVMALVAFALTASSALAHDGGSDKHAKAHDKAQDVAKTKKNKRGYACRHRVGLVLRGELVELITDESDSTVLVGFRMIVKKSNKARKRFVVENATAEHAVMIVVGEKTKIRRRGQGRVELGELMEGDRIKVKFRVCRHELRNDDETTPELYAKHIKARPAVTDESGDDATSGAGDAEASDESTNDETPTDA